MRQRIMKSPFAGNFVFAAALLICCAGFAIFIADASAGLAAPLIFGTFIVMIGFVLRCVLNDSKT